MPEQCAECLYWPTVVRTAEHVAVLVPSRAYWAACVVCGTTIDLAAAVKARVTAPTGS
jgi:hypothetical protein